MLSYKLLILGFGYTARFVYEQLSVRRLPVVATSRQLPANSSPGLAIIDFNATAVQAHLATVTHILVSVPPTAVGDPVLGYFAELLTQHVQQLQWIGYLSSTAVYGDHQGGWVDEQSACLQPSRTGQQRLAAERAWSAFATQSSVPLTIFRVAGIYGPGRSPLDRLVAGQHMTIDKPDQVFSRIHVHDLAASIVTAMLHPELAGIYNVADDEPASAPTVDAYAAQLLGVPTPEIIPYAKALLSPRVQEFYQANRRVSNAKLKRELGVQLAFPSFREGFSSLLSCR